MRNSLMPVMRGSLSHMIDSQFNSLIDEFFDNAFPTTLIKQDSYPKYNIKRLRDDNNNGFIIEMALAGWEKDNIEIYTEEGTLFIESKTQDAINSKEDTSDYFYKGISKRSFSWSMNLPKYAVVNDTKFENGLLSLTVKVEVPEEQKRKIIEIK